MGGYWGLMLKTRERQRNDTAHQHPADVAREWPRRFLLRRTHRRRLVYWTYLGAAMSRSRLTGERLAQTLAELKRIGLGGLPEKRRGLRHGSGL
jgi:hypothetical protein